MASPACSKLLGEHNLFRKTVSLSKIMPRHATQSTRWAGRRRALIARRRPSAHLSCRSLRPDEVFRETAPMWRWAASVLVALSLTFGGGHLRAARAAEQVDLLLVLAADVSRSIDAQKLELERRGYAAALSDPRVLQAIAAGPNGRIAIAFVEWAGANSQKLLIDWTLVRDGNDTKLVVNRLLEAPRSFADRTAIGAGIDFARAQ